MRLVSFLKEGRWCPALRRGDNIVEIANSDLVSAQAVIAAVVEGRKLAEGRSHPLADITLGLPVPEPGKIVCIGLNYVDHAKEGGNPIRITPPSSSAPEARWWRMASPWCGRCARTSSTTKPNLRS